MKTCRFCGGRGYLGTPKAPYGPTPCDCVMDSDEDTPDSARDDVEPADWEIERAECHRRGEAY